MLPVLYRLERFHGPVKKEEKDTSGALTCQQCITCRCWRREETAPVDTQTAEAAPVETAEAAQTARALAKSGFKWEQTAGKSAEELEGPQKTASA